VKYTYERFLTIKGNGNKPVLEMVDKIEALDKHTVKFKLSEPFAWFLDALAATSTWIVAREAVEKFGDLKKPEAVIGTGPWMLERDDPNVKAVFVRHPGYFLPGLPYAEAVEVSIDRDPASRFAGWLSGTARCGGPASRSPAPTVPCAYGPRSSRAVTAAGRGRGRATPATALGGRPGATGWCWSPSRPPTTRCTRS